MNSDGVTWSKIARPEARFDFEDWRYAEPEIKDTEANGSLLVNMSRLPEFRDLYAEGFEIEKIFYPLYWSIEAKFETASNDDDLLLMSLDDDSRRFAQAGHPDAVLRLAWICTQWFGVEAEALRWLNRANYLLGDKDRCYPWPADKPEEDFLEYFRGLPEVLEGQLQSFETKFGYRPILSELADVGPTAKQKYCAVCGIELVGPSTKGDCDTFFFNQFMDSTEPAPSDLEIWKRSHGSLTIDDAYARWPAGIEGKIPPRAASYIYTRFESDGSSKESDKLSELFEVINHHDDSEQTVQGPKFCSQCGAKYSSLEVKFCGECGTRRA